MHSPVMAPHFQIGVGILNDHQPDTGPEEEASPKDCRIAAHNMGSCFQLQSSRNHPFAPFFVCTNKRGTKSQKQHLVAT